MVCESPNTDLASEVAEQLLLVSQERLGQSFLEEKSAGGRILGALKGQWIFGAIKVETHP